MSGSTPGPRVTVVAFDVDGTLTTRDCVVPFMWSITGPARLLGRLTRRAHHLVAPSIRRQRDRLKALGTEAAFAGLDAAELRERGGRFAERVAAERLRPDTNARLQWHREAGHRIVLVSASYEIYLWRLAELLGADAALGTRLEVVEGHCTGALDGPNCRGPEKVRRLHEWLADHHGGRRAVELWAYGDSIGDRELIADADRGVWVEGVLTRAPGPDRGGR